MSDKPPSKLPVKRAFSAGGVVYRRNNATTQVIICGQKQKGLWGLPKGTPQKGETAEQTAVREVGEETGLQVVIVAKIGDIQYWFVEREEGVRYFKTVSHYLMQPTGGDLANHDPEFDVVEWRDIDQAMDTLSYRNEVDILRKAKELIEQRESPSSHGL
jgi:8-oxo-dGTP pyrophosphatase MutT (NUDIX family)